MTTLKTVTVATCWLTSHGSPNASAAIPSQAYLVRYRATEVGVVRQIDLGPSKLWHRLINDALGGSDGVLPQCWQSPCVCMHAPC
jgi:hypothetical protein